MRLFASSTAMALRVFADLFGAARLGKDGVHRFPQLFTGEVFFFDHHGGIAVYERHGVMELVIFGNVRGRNQNGALARGFDLR